MTLEPVEVIARWDPKGRFDPSQIVWKGRTYLVESTGRGWEDMDGLHVLCMLPGGQVVELVFQLNPARWMIRPPLAAPRMG
jgi:hypothetical protein